MRLPLPHDTGESPDACAACAATIDHVANLRLDARCPDCGRYYLADTASNDARASRVTGLHPAAAVPAPSAEIAPRPEAHAHPPHARATRQRHEGPRRVWHAPENDDGPQRVAREREPRVIEDPELVRVRELLSALRPERVGPFSWGPYETSADVAIAPEPPRVHVQVSPGGGGGGLWNWSGGGTPRLPETPRARSAIELVADRIATIAIASPEAARTLRWLQVAGTLKDGLSALYRTTGEALIDEATRARWEARPGARSEGARVVGRRLILAAESAWVQGG
jgi:hypothetical protein